MKLTNLLSAVGLGILFSTPVFAESQNMTVAELTASLAKASSPENVKAVALQQKILNCEQNAKNYKYEGSQKEKYLATCINQNYALLAFESHNKQRNLRLANSVNEMLNSSPTAAGNK